MGGLQDLRDPQALDPQGSALDRPTALLMDPQAVVALAEVEAHWAPVEAHLALPAQPAPTDLRTSVAPLTIGDKLGTLTTYVYSPFLIRTHSESGRN